MREKIDSLLGFALKSGKLVLGIDNILEGRKRKFLIIAASELSERGMRSCVTASEAFKIPLVITTKSLNDVLHKDNCKIVALTDSQMAEAILKNLSLNYTLFNQEESN